MIFELPKRKLPPRDWHVHFCWLPVKAHDYFHEGKFPKGEPRYVIWFEAVWRRFDGVGNAHYVRRSYPKDRVIEPEPGRGRI